MNALRYVLSISTPLFLLAAACGGDEPGRCNPSNCVGCCFGDACAPGTTSAACGHSGVACKICTSVETCGTQRSCVPATWTVRPTQAAVPDKDNGDDWDAPYSPPDVKVYTRCPGGSEFESEEVESFTPQWATGACTGNTAQLLDNPLQIRVVDVDLVFHDTIAEFAHQVTQDELFSGGFQIFDVQQLDLITFSITKAN